MKELTRKILSFLDRHIFLQYIITAVILTILLEMLNRRSPVKGLVFFFQSPVAFFYNVFIIFLTLFVSLLLKRRRFAAAFVSLCWILCGIANCIILGFRMTPFSAIDLLMIPSAIQMADSYISPGLIVLIVVVFAAFFGSLVILWKKLPKDEGRRNRFAILGGLAVLFISFRIFVNVGIEAQALSDNFENLAMAYENYGFAYCFSNSIVDIGIGRPEDYSEETVDKIIDRLAEDTASSSKTPNIIMIQLESFFDPYYMKNFGFSKDPIPTFRYLKKNYSSGYLTVPSVGAGTANTEFEILTGMSTSYFGAGEYPFKTVMTGITAESLPYLLRESGYRSYAIHNNSGTFYNRHIVFSNLGFDRFTPLEYMYHTSLTPNNWAKDDILPDEIFKCLDDSAGSDFIYTISVQSHGRYPETEVLSNPEIKVTSGSQSQNLNPYTYYVNEIYEVDAMLAELIQRLTERNEPTVLVLYGDHLPALPFTAADLAQPSLFETEYVIWDNIGLEKEHKNLTADMLSTYLLERLDLKGGLMKRFHETYQNSPDYEAYQEILEYDLLYGEGYALKESVSYEPTSLGLGIDPVTVTSCSAGEEVYVYGKNFNEYSTIMINGKDRETEYIDSETLRLIKHSAEPGDVITVGQIGVDGILLGTSNEITLD